MFLPLVREDFLQIIKYNKIYTSNIWQRKEHTNRKVQCGRKVNGMVTVVYVLARPDAFITNSCTKHKTTRHSDAIVAVICTHWLHLLKNKNTGYVLYWLSLMKTQKIISCMHVLPSRQRAYIVYIGYRTYVT